jgi:alkanesulfonate monooxygenase SsuD/methylene tetrahydromethanopterin reductase-like flavin-dependent oxidoreductase (luciferase family)
MRISYSLGSLLTIEQVLECAKISEKHSPDTIWIPETWGMENFTMLSAVSQKNRQSKIGSSIINIFSRSPSLIAMGAVTIDAISNGRFIIGLGTSSDVIVENFHGDNFKNPVLRMKECVEIIKLALSGKKIDYAGNIFNLKNFNLMIKPKRTKIPIYLAAVNNKMIELAWDIADGVIFYLRPMNEMKETIQKMQSKKRIDVTSQLITCMSDDSELAFNRTKKTLAFYVAVGKVYREFLANNGFKNETKNIFEEYHNNGLESLEEYVPDNMIKELTVCGTPLECVKQIRNFTECGIDLPIIQFNPVNNVLDSFNLLTNTLARELN